MEQRFATDERYAHRAEIANLSDPELEIFELGMRLGVIVLGAIGAIEIALVGQVKTALEWLAIEQPLAGFKNVVSGKFAADLIEQIHGVRGAWTLRRVRSAVTRQ